jgi:tRNA A37 threonylcarbamoyladenosine synthetase subunit TsaC/SUA5/YrdC
MLFFTSTPWLDQTATIIDTFGYLYMSSANITGGASATTAAAAGQAFGDKLIVLDGDPWRDPTRLHGSTTMVRLSRDGDVAVARPGITSAAFGADLEAYANNLSQRWRAASQSARPS